MFADTFDLRLTFAGENSGYNLAVAAGSFFIQPLGSSCGFCSSAVVSKPIPHHRPYWLVDIKVCRFPPLHFGCVKGFPPLWCRNGSGASNFLLSRLFPSLCGSVCTDSPEFKQGRTTAVSFARLAVGSTLRAAAATRAAPDRILAESRPIRCAALVCSTI